MVVGYLTVVFADHVTEKAAHDLVDQFASDIIAHGAVDAVKCDTGVMGEEEQDSFWREAQEQ